MRKFDDLVIKNLKSKLIITGAAAMVGMIVFSFSNLSEKNDDRKSVSVQNQTPAETLQTEEAAEKSTTEAEYIPFDNYFNMNDNYYYEDYDYMSEQNNEELYYEDQTDELSENMPELPESLNLWFENFSENMETIDLDSLPMEFISQKQMISEWKSWKSFYGDDSFNTDNYQSDPESAVKKMYCNPNWIPIAMDNGGNYIGADLDPDINGTVGQIINFGCDEKKKYVFDDSIDEFAELLKDNHDLLSQTTHLTDGLIANGLYKSASE